MTGSVDARDTPRLTDERERLIRRDVVGTEPHDSVLPAWMVQVLLAEVDFLRAKVVDQSQRPLT